MRRYLARLPMEGILSPFLRWNSITMATTKRMGKLVPPRAGVLRIRLRGCPLDNQPSEPRAAKWDKVRNEMAYGNWSSITVTLEKDDSLDPPEPADATAVLDQTATVAGLAYDAHRDSVATAIGEP